MAAAQRLTASQAEHVRISFCKEMLRSFIGESQRRGIGGSSISNADVKSRRSSVGEVKKKTFLKPRACEDEYTKEKREYGEEHFKANTG